MRVLLDCNVLVWMYLDHTRLTSRVRRILEAEGNTFFVSRTSFWELSAAVATGRLPMPGRSIQYIIDLVVKAGLPILELEDRYVLRTETLPYHHSDPFDRILVAQALEEGLTILSSDSKLPLYDAPLVWQ